MAERHLSDFAARTLRQLTDEWRREPQEPPTSTMRVQLKLAGQLENLLAALLLETERDEAEARAEDEADGRRALTNQELYDALLGRLGYVEDAELTADGSADNDLAHERVRAVLAYMRRIRHSTMPADAAEHLTPTTTDRGFKHLPPVVDAYDGVVRAYESSAAEAPHIWLQVSGPGRDATAHLPLEAARQVAEQLMWLVDHHYQVES